MDSLAKFSDEQSLLDVLTAGIMQDKTLSLQSIAKLSGLSNKFLFKILSDLSNGSIPEPFFNALAAEVIASQTNNAIKNGFVPYCMTMMLIEYAAFVCKSPQAYISYDYFIKKDFFKDYKLVSWEDALEAIERISKNFNTPKKKKCNARKKPEGKETRICARLSKELNAKREVSTPSGRIDLLTSGVVIEVKTFKDWKGGIGQLQAYQSYYPEHSKRLHLFDLNGETDGLSDIKYVCSLLDIELTIEVDKSFEERLE